MKVKKLKGRELKETSARMSSFLRKLAATYVYNCQGKSEADKKKLFDLINNQWIDKCEQLNRVAVGGNFKVNGFEDMVKNKETVDTIEQILGIKKSLPQRIIEPLKKLINA